MPAAALGLAGEAQGVWSRVVRSAGASSPILRAVLTNATLETVDGDAAVVTCASRFLPGARKLQGAIAQALSRELGREMRVDLRSSDAEEAPSLAAALDAATPEADAHARTSAEPASRPSFNPNLAVEQALVKQAIELFGARVVEVKPR